MLKNCITCCLFLTLTLPIISAQMVNTSAIVDPAIQEAFSYSAVVNGVIEVYVRDSLPEEAKLEGEQILLNVQEGLKTCESKVHIPADIWEYKTCSSGLLRDGMAALNALQRKYRPFSTSSASKIKLFW